MRRQRSARTTTTIVVIALLVAASVVIISLASWLLLGESPSTRKDKDNKPHEAAQEGSSAHVFSPAGTPASKPATLAAPPPRPALVDLVIGGKQRGPSRDFVTGDGFRFASDFVFDDTMVALDHSPASVVRDVANCRIRISSSSQTTTSSPSFVVVFVQTHMLEQFLDLWLPLPHACPIRLITHNSDYSSPYEVQNPRWKNGQTSAYLRQRRDVLENPDVQIWFAQNAVVIHPKLQPIGIGVENRYNKYGRHVDVYEAHHFLRKTTPRVHGEERRGGGRQEDETRKLLFVSFSIKTNPKERGEALRAAKSPTASFLPSDVTFYNQPPPKKAAPEAYASALHRFLETMSHHRFVLAPHGHGVDTHRLWEALYAGCIPIVLTGAMDAHLLEELPVLLVSSYADLSREFLLHEESRLSPRFDDVKRVQLLNMSYWASRLRS